MHSTHSSLITLLLIVSCQHSRWSSAASISPSSASMSDACTRLSSLLQNNKTKACRCLGNFGDGAQLWIGCTRESMPNISASLNGLLDATAVEKLWLWDNVIPIVPTSLFTKVRPTKLMIESSMLMGFRTGALDLLGEHLQSLELKNNLINALRIEDFRQLRKLRRLDLSGNRLTKLDSGSIGNFSLLDTLMLQDNNISTIGDFAFRGMPNLRTLSLARNQLTTISKNMFYGLEKLESLDLQNNRIASIEPGAFASLRSLRHLNLGSNLLSDIQLADLANLEKLFLNNNSFVDLEATVKLQQLNRLQVLNLDKNQLNRLPARFFSSLKSLQILSLTNNRIAELQTDSLAGLGSLRTLSLQNNAIASIPAGLFRHVPNLDDLFLSKNKLTTLESGVFSGLAGLQVLSVAHNDLSSIAADAFRELKSLEKLYLNDNSLQTLDAAVLSAVQDSLYSLDISDNPWNCDCRIFWLLSWTRSHAEQLRQPEAVDGQAGEADSQESSFFSGFPTFGDSKAAVSEEALQCVQGNVSEIFETLKLACQFSGYLQVSSAWVTTIGTVLGVSSLLILACIVLLYVQDHRTLMLSKGPLKRVPSDMVDLLPKR